MDADTPDPNRKDIIFGRHAQEKWEQARTLRRRMTPAEKHLWQCLRRSQLAGLHFRRTQIIDGFLVDFYCHAAALVIEADGEIHKNQVDYDAERSRILERRGLMVLRFENERILHQTDQVLMEILQAAQSRIKSRVTQPDRHSPFPACEAGESGKGVGGLGRKG